MFKQLFGGIGEELRATRDDMKPGPRKRTITVAKPFCAPCRNIITGALQPYGVKIHRIVEYPLMIDTRGLARRMKVELKQRENLKYGVAAPIYLPGSWTAHVTVNEQAAAWAEYLLLRTGRLYVPGRYVNARNEQWAKRHGGQMPPAWNEGKPWIETSCKEGMKAWRPLREAAKSKGTERE